ncbi:MAG: polysialyltransferase family glycosyltransferase [Paeniclostridium sordellii]|nr:polysialyltransferase family glycosyltransferase [Paeniclostridium sordellii]
MNIFISHTPYHIILILSLVKSEYKNQDNDLLIYNDFDLKNIDMQKLKLIFRNVYIYDREINIKSTNIRLIDSKRKFKYRREKIKKLITNKYYDTIFVCNDSVFETQCIIENNLKTKNQKVVYIEDGSNSYCFNNAKFYKQDDRIKKFLKKFVYGINYENLNNIFGTHSKIVERRMIWPEITRKELQNDKKPIREITKEQLILGLSDCYSEIIKNIKNKKRALIILEHIDFFSNKDDIHISEYKFILSKVISEFTKKGINVCIKYHPRDNSNYINEIIEENDNIEIIENSIPIEVYYLQKDISIISITSTALLSATKIINNNSIVSLMDIMRVKDINLRYKFYQIGVRLPKDINSLICILDEF